MPQKIHPLTMILYLLIVFFICITVNHPLYIIVLFVFLIIDNIMLGFRKQLLRLIVYSFYGAFFILIINSFISKHGETIIFSCRLIPFATVLQITFESLVFSVNMMIKLVCVFLMFSLYSVAIDKDEVFSLALKYMPRTVITISLAINTLNKLRIDVPRIKGVLLSRGARFNHKNMYRRIKSYYPMLKVVVISSLEGALTTAEAIYSRRYGQCKRTNYSRLNVGIVDYIVNLLNFILFSLLAYALISGAGRYRFYPQLQAFNKTDIVIASVLSINLIIILILLFLNHKDLNAYFADE